MRHVLSILLIPIFFLTTCGPARENRIVVGSKNFTEQAILGEIFAQRLERKTSLRIERRFYLAGSFICQQAIVSGRIDMYPEYTGTALTAILKEPPQRGNDAVFQRVKSEYERRFQLTLNPPLGFDNTFALEIRGDDARRLQLKTISQAAQYTPQWHAGFGYELDGGASYALTPWLTASGSIGFQNGENSFGRMNWDVGAVASLGQQWLLDVRYSGTNIDRTHCYFTNWCATGFNATVTYQFGWTL